MNDLNEAPYFIVKYFAIYDIDNSKDIPIEQEIKANISKEKYYLNSNKDEHYTPENFFTYLRDFSMKYPNVKFIVFYKYEYFNHDHINTYQNKLSVYNQEIVDNLIG
jgi:hypothetical protein|uniref:Uncharacterized protein n=1 Tax=viral metagenome TaxID=1070528 RepID=A0A6C0H0T3_9ZZZZ